MLLRNVNACCGAARSQDRVLKRPSTLRVDVSSLQCIRLETEVQEARHLCDHPDLIEEYHPPFTANADDFTAVLLRRDCAAPENLSKQVGEAMLRELAEKFPDAPVTDDSALRTPLYQVGRSLVPRKWMPAP